LLSGQNVLASVAFPSVFPGNFANLTVLSRVQILLTAVHALAIS